MFDLALKPDDLVFHGSFDDCVYGSVDDGIEGSVQVATRHRATAQRFFADILGVHFSEVRVSTHYARFLTRQEVWDSHGADRWLDSWFHNNPQVRFVDGSWRYADYRLASIPEPPQIVPDSWEPDERDPVWEFCSKDATDAQKIYICEEK